MQIQVQEVVDEKPTRMTNTEVPKHHMEKGCIMPLVAAEMRCRKSFRAVASLQ